MSEFDIFKLIRSTPSRDKKSTRSRIEEDFPTNEAPKIEDFIEGTEEKKYKNRERKVIKKDEFLNEEIVERKKEKKYKNQLRKINLVELDKLSAKNQNKVLIREYIETFEKLESYENELEKLDEKINGNNVMIHHIQKESIQFRDAIRSFVSLLPNGSEAKRQLETNHWKIEEVTPLILSKIEELVDRAKNIDVHIEQATKQLNAENKTLQKKFVQQQTEISKRDQYIEELKNYYEEQMKALTKQHQQTLQKSKQHYETEMQKIKQQYDAQFQKIIQQQEAEKQQVRQQLEPQIKKQLEQQIKQQLEPQIKQQLEQQIKQQLEKQMEQQIKHQVNQQVNQKIQSTKQRLEKEIADLKQQLQAAKEQAATQPTITPVPITPPATEEINPTSEEDFHIPAPTFETPSLPSFEIEEPTLPEAPSFETEAPALPEAPSFEVEEPNLPSFEVEEPTIPSFEVETPEIPSLEEEVLSIPSFELEEPEVPTFEVEEPTIPSFEVEEPTIPSFELDVPEIPSLEVEEPTIPSFEIEEPTISTPEEAPSVPSFEMEEPELPSFDLPAPPAFDLPAPPSLDIPAPPSFEEPEEEEEEDDSDELVMFDSEPYLRSLSDTNKAIIKIIGKTGVSRNKELKDFLETDEESIDLFMKGSKFNQQEMSSTIKGLKDAGFLNAETVKLGAKGGYNFTVYELSDLGKGIYKSLTGKKAVVSEKKKITDQHASLEHGYLIKESATEFAEMGYKVYTDRKDLRFDLPGGKRKDFDIIIEKDGKKCMIEVERGTHNEEDFFNAMDKIFQITNEFYFICPNEQILFGKTKIAFFRWIKERLGGIQNAKGKLTAYFTTLEKVKKRGKTIWEPVDFK